MPSGELYARLADKMDIHTYQSLIDLLTRSKLIRVDSHLIQWIGPAKTA